MTGKAFVFGDNVDTDLIVPGSFLTLSKPEELAAVCMAGIDSGFAARIEQGDVFVGGRNFGCGSSREHAPISIKHAGVSCVIAESFARIFYRNSLNIGLPLLESKEASNAIKEGDLISTNLKEGKIVNHTRDEVYTFTPFPQFALEIMQAGGMVNYIKNQRPDTGGN